MVVVKLVNSFSLSLISLHSLNKEAAVKQTQDFKQLRNEKKILEKEFKKTQVIDTSQVHIRVKHLARRLPSVLGECHVSQPRGAQEPGHWMKQRGPPGWPFACGARVAAPLPGTDALWFVFTGKTWWIFQTEKWKGWVVSQCLFKNSVLTCSTLFLTVFSPTF